MTERPADIRTDDDDGLLLQHLCVFITDEVEFGCQVRPIATAANDSLFDALLREIDGTILPRRLTFKSDDSNVLDLDVADRRVMRVVAATGPWASVVRDPLLGQLLSPSVEADAAKMLDLLFIFSAGRQTVTVRSQREDSITSAGSCGIPTSALRQLSRSTTEPEQRLAGLDRFIAALGPTAIAYLLRRAGTFVRGFGDIIQQQALHDLFDVFVEETVENDATVGPKQMVILSTGSGYPIELGNGTALLLASDGRLQLLVWLDAANLCAATVVWMKNMS